MAIQVHGQLEFNDDNQTVQLIYPHEQPFRMIDDYSIEDADAICKILIRNPHKSISRVFPYPVFRASLPTKPIVAWEVPGESLQDRVLNGVDFVSLQQDELNPLSLRNHRIASEYKDILRALFTGVLYMMEHNLNWSYLMADIYVQNSKPVLVGLKYEPLAPDETLNQRFEEHCKGLAKIIREMNEACHYNPGANKDMETLLSCIDPAERPEHGEKWQQKGREAALSLFYTTADIQYLIVNTADELKRYDRLTSMKWPDYFSESVEGILENNELVDFNKQIIAYKKMKRDKLIAKGVVNVGDGSAPRSNTVNAVLLTRNIFEHFESFAVAGVNSEEDVIKILAKVAPKYLIQLIEIAKVLESSSKDLRGTIIPSKQFIDDFFSIA